MAIGFQLVAFGTLGAAALVGGIVFGHGETAVVGGLTIGGLTFSYGKRLAGKRRWKQFYHAVTWGDRERARRCWVLAQRHLDAAAVGQPYNRLMGALVSMVEEDWPAAQVIFDSIPNSSSVRHLVGAQVRCLAELDPARALTLAQEALVSDDLEPAFRRSVLTALALAQLRTSQPEKALRTLDEAAPLPQHDGQRASAALVRGDALRALGRESEAREAYARTITLAPRSVSARHARARLALQPPPAYR